MSTPHFHYGVVSATKSCNALNSIRSQRQQFTSHTVEVVNNNKKSLPVVYNKIIDKVIDSPAEWLVLCHNDINLENLDVSDRILQTGYDVVGVAGPITANIKSPALWHLMGGGMDGVGLRGAVAHGTITKKHMTSFGPYPHRTVMLDGVFMAINRKVFEQIRFDESNPAKFHFYDLSYSLECHLKGFKVGVGDIQITHESPGLKEVTDEWKAGEKWFLNKYGNGKE